MDENAKRLRVLFLCVANSCRSQMAEGLARHFFPKRIEAFSAGIFAAGLSQQAATVMAESGIDISGQTSKDFGKLLDEEFDNVITLCGELEEKCPVFPGKARHIHMEFDDPTFSPGSEEERLERHRQIRDEMRRRLNPLLEKLLSGEEPSSPEQSRE